MLKAANDSKMTSPDVPHASGMSLWRHRDIPEAWGPSVNVNKLNIGPKEHSRYEAVQSQQYMQNSLVNS